MLVFASASVKIVQKYVETLGISIEKLYANTGVDVKKINDPEYKITYKSSDAVFANAARLTKNKCYAINCGETFQISDLGVLGYIISNTDNILTVIQKYIYYQEIIGLLIKMELKEVDNTVQVVFIDGFDAVKLPASRYRIECSMSCFLKLCSILIGKPLVIQEIKFFEKSCNNKQYYIDYFKAPIKWGQSTNMIIFPKDYLSAQKIINKSTMNYLEQYAHKILLTKNRGAGFSEKIKRYIIDNCNNKISLETIANHFFINPRTLQIKLKEEGTTYREIITDLKKERALQLIHDKNIPIVQIAYLLGFEDVSPFIRAFKRWTGTTPGMYRKQLYESGAG